MNFDLDAYFLRIGYTEKPQVDLPTLRKLHLHHAYAISFENINSFIGNEVSLSEADLSAKLILQNRGGYCFEQNSLFLAVLKKIGFKAKGLGARVLYNQPDESIITRRSHMLLAVELEGSTYLADVGFGGLTLTMPLLFRPGLLQHTTHENFRIETIDNDFKLEAQVAGEWKTIYRFDLQEQYAPDYDVVNYYLSTHPTSPFVTGLIAARPHPQGRYALKNAQFSSYHLDGKVDKKLLNSVDEIKQALTQFFGINLPQDSRLDVRLASLLHS